VLLFDVVSHSFKALMPFRRKEIDRGACVVHDDLRRQLGTYPASSAFALNPTPDIEIGSFVGSRDIS